MLLFTIYFQIFVACFIFFFIAEVHTEKYPCAQLRQRHGLLSIERNLGLCIASGDNMQSSGSAAT